MKQFEFERSVDYKMTPVNNSLLEKIDIFVGVSSFVETDGT